MIVGSTVWCFSFKLLLPIGSSAYYSVVVPSQLQLPCYKICLQELVTELYEFESSYIDTHGLSVAGKKKDAVWKQLEQVLKDLNKIQSEFHICI